ncbi:Gfo/Idh/MocA family protein [Zhengella sp. ZM62]|uniref:Gfo/Idh/MocA family protein n=1 Tax=Zhengella sedimenti TaxID=3390035 RepID=UPI003975845B
MVRYGFIGAGMMGQEHLRNLALLDGVTVTGIADPDAGMRAVSLATQGGTARVFQDYRDLIAADICDAYVICSPNDAHHAALLDVLPANKPVLCEKPMCTTVEHCRDIVSRQSGRSAPLWVAMEYRYMPPMQRLLAEVEAGTAGQPVMMAIREHRFPFLVKVGDWNRFSSRTGGTLVEKCCHFWDLMRLVLKSDPVRVYASGAMDVNHRDERYAGEVPDIIDNAFVVVDFENGTRGMLDLCMFAEGSWWQEVVSVTGPRARIDACVPGPARFAPDGRERRSRIVVSDRASKVETVEDIEVDETILGAGDHHGSTFYQHQRFLDLVRTGRGEPEVTAQDGLWSVLVGVAAEQSARTGQAIDLRSFHP